MDQSYHLRTKRVVSQPSAVSMPDIFAEEYDDVWPSRTPGSVRRYRSDVTDETGRIQQADVQPWQLQEQQTLHTTTRSAIPSRRTATQPGAKRASVDTEDFVLPQIAHVQQQSRVHWLVYCGGAFIIMILGWSLLSAVFNWWQITQDDWRYGRPRTFQTDQVVGHSDSASNKSHFIALNLGSRIQVVEFPGGDGANAKMYVGPQLIGQGQDLAPVTLSFVDVNGDQKVDMVIHVQESRFVFINEKSEFRPLRQGERIHLP